MPVLAAPAVSCAMCEEMRTTSIQYGEHSGIPAQGVDGLMPALSLETNSSCLHRCRLDGSNDPVGQMRHRQLAPATGVGTTTVLPYVKRRSFWRMCALMRLNSPCGHLPRRRPRVHHIRLAS